MTSPYLGEIQLFSFNFAPQGWATCNGATLPLQQYAALFSLLGIAYGGNGTSTFLLPNLASRAPCSQGQGPGLTPRTLGQSFGTSSVTLTSSEVPAHNHMLAVYAQNTTSKRSGTAAPGNYLSDPLNSATTTYSSAAPNTTLTSASVAQAGGNQPHDNQQPYLAVNFCIALQGAFPAFS